MLLISPTIISNYYHGERNKKVDFITHFWPVGKVVSYHKDTTDIPACAVISVPVCPERHSNIARIYNTILVTGTKWFGLVMTLRQYFMNPCSEGVILQTVNRIGVLATYGHSLCDIIYNKII